MKSLILDSIHVSFLIDLAIRTQLLHPSEPKSKTQLHIDVLNIVAQSCADDGEDSRLSLSRMIHARMTAMDGIVFTYTKDDTLVQLSEQGEEQLDAVCDGIKSVLDAAGLVIV